MPHKLLFIFSLVISRLTAQFPGQVGTLGTTAIHKDSSVFISWAAQCKVTRGYQDISNTSLGYTTIGDSSMVTSKADGSVVSLGDGGSAIITFTTPITNGTGYDFAVFENAFNDTFLELAFVEVSSDGMNYFRFPPTCNLPVSPQYTNDAAMDATKIDNLAGKYRALYGTPFDLQELNGIPLLDITKITHVKIIDVVGSINTLYASYDQNNNLINDPWPTPFPSSGFDLDAVGVINQAAVGIREYEKNYSVKIYPNPSGKIISIECPEFSENTEIKILNIQGEILRKEIRFDKAQRLDVSDLYPGIYFISVESEKRKSITKLIKE